MTNPFAEFANRYAPNAALFVEEMLGMDGRDSHLGPLSMHTIDPEQREVLDAVSRGERRITIRSGHGVGKTTLLAWIIVWWICTKFPQKTVCTAPTSAQLFDALAAETSTWVKKLPPELAELFEIKSDQIIHRSAPKESFVSFRTSRPETPEALAGVHSANVLLIADEASGIPQQVYESAQGSMSGVGVFILAGNPVRTTGLFYDSHNKLKNDWHTVHISCVGHRRISPDFVQQMANQYGPDSNEYRVRVLGEFPKAENDAVIPWELKEAALFRDVRPLLVSPIWGVDCATSGGDRVALAKRKGNVLMEKVKWWKDLDTMQIVGRIKEQYDQTPAHERPHEIEVDSIGLGAGVADRLREIGLPARGVNVSELPALRDRFRNLKAELWFTAREWFEARDCNLAGDTELGDELVAVQFDPPTSAGQIRIEKKDKTMQRLNPRRSPDLADAFILTFAGNAATALYGDKDTRNWKEPLKRNIKGII